MWRTAPGDLNCYGLAFNKFLLPAFFKEGWRALLKGEWPIIRGDFDAFVLSEKEGWKGNFIKEDLVSATINLFAAGLVGGILLLSGCERGAQNMYDQPKDEPLEASRFFADGQSSRPLVPGTVAQDTGAFAGPSSGRAGQTNTLINPDVGLPLPVTPQVAELGQGRFKVPRIEPLVVPVLVTLQLLKRGQERFNIYCSPCHSHAGDGLGMVVMRGFQPPPSYHTYRLRSAPDGYLYSVITHGHGAGMFSYAERVTPEDRWAIVAYIRALQLSQHATFNDVPEQERPKLQGAGK